MTDKQIEKLRKLSKEILIQMLCNAHEVIEQSNITYQWEDTQEMKDHEFSLFHRDTDHDADPDPHGPSIKHFQD